MSYCLAPRCQKPFNPETANFCQHCGSKLLLGDRFRVLKPLSVGRGFLARDEHRPAKSACWLQRLIVPAISPQLIKEYWQQLAMRLERLGTYPQFPALLAYLELPDCCYMVQEWPIGVSLSEMISEGPFTETQVRQLLAEVLPMMQIIHAYQVIHCNIYPETLVRRTVDGQWSLIHFSLSEIADVSDGSEIYIAPEQRLGQVNFSSDLYSLGVTCLHALTGSDPNFLFDTQQQVWEWHDHIPHPVSPALRHLIDKLIAVRVEQRYTSPTEVLQDLHRSLRQPKKIRPLPPPPISQVSQSAAHAAAPPASPPSPPIVPPAPVTRVQPAAVPTPEPPPANPSPILAPVPVPLEIPSLGDIGLNGQGTYGVPSSPAAVSAERSPDPLHPTSDWLETDWMDTDRRMPTSGEIDALLAFADDAESEVDLATDSANDQTEFLSPLAPPPSDGALESDTADQPITTYSSDPRVNQLIDELIGELEDLEDDLDSDLDMTTVVQRPWPGVDRGVDGSTAGLDLVDDEVPLEDALADQLEPDLDGFADLDALAAELEIMDQSATMPQESDLELVDPTVASQIPVDTASQHAAAAIASYADHDFTDQLAVSAGGNGTRAGVMEASTSDSGLEQTRSRLPLGFGGQPTLYTQAAIAQLTQGLLADDQSVAVLEDLILATTEQEMLMGQLQPDLFSSSGTESPTVNSSPLGTVADTFEDFPPLQLLNQIESLQGQDSVSAEIADVYRDLGNFYRDRLLAQHRDRTGNDTIHHLYLVIAIHAYQQALMWLPDDSCLWPYTLNELAYLLRQISRSSLTTEPLLYLERAIKTYQMAVEKVHSETQANACATIYSNLGEAYGDLARHHEPQINLQQAVQAYEESLRHRSAMTDPLKYAATQNNLGTACWNLAQYETPMEHLKQAISAYNEALHYYNPDQEPLSYAMIQNNLGTAYWNLSHYDQKAEFLALAIAAYQVALLYRKPEDVPAAWAATQNNLGTAYLELAELSKATPDLRNTYLKGAISGYESVLAIVEANGYSASVAINFDLLATHNNLGLAYFRMATDPQISDPNMADHLTVALRHQLRALTGWHGEPELYNSALIDLANTIHAIRTKTDPATSEATLTAIPAEILTSLIRV